MTNQSSNRKATKETIERTQKIMDQEEYVSDLGRKVFGAGVHETDAPTVARLARSLNRGLIDGMRPHSPNAISATLLYALELVINSSLKPLQDTLARTNGEDEAKCAVDALRQGIAWSILNPKKARTVVEDGLGIS